MAHWDRSEPQFFDVWDLGWEKASDLEFFSGVEIRTMSKDPDTGAGTYMVRFPPEWSHEVTGEDATMEMFIVDGAITANGQRLGAGGFVAVPKNHGPADLETEGGAQAYVFWNTEWQDDYYYDNQVQIDKVWEKDWILTEMPGLLPGIMHKSLRWPDANEGLFHGGPNGMLRFIMITPGFGDPRQEVHWDSWEENVWLSGDWLMPGRGLCAAGSFLANPAGLKHGPVFTSKGSLLIAHCNAPIGAEFYELQDAAGKEIGSELKRAFQNEESWWSVPRHTNWRDRPEYSLYPSTDPAYPARLNSTVNQPNQSGQTS